MSKAISAGRPRAVSAATTIAASLVMSVLASITPAAAGAAFTAQDKFIADFCKEYHGASSCGDWRRNRARWSNERYQSFYFDHRYESAFNTAGAAAAFGLATRLAPDQDVGAQTLETAAPIIEVIGGGQNHADDCRAAFRSYNADTDTYLGFDGLRHTCRL